VPQKADPSYVPLAKLAESTTVRVAVVVEPTLTLVDIVPAGLRVLEVQEVVSHGSVTTRLKVSMSLQNVPVGYSLKHALTVTT